MADELPKEIKEKIENFLERFAREYPNSGVAVNLPLILEDMALGVNGFSEEIITYMTKIFSTEKDRLPKAEANALEIHLEIMEDFLNILKTGDVNVLDFVRKQETAARYKDFLEQGIKLSKFLQEWLNIMAELRESQMEEFLSGSGEHNCATCRSNSICPVKGFKQSLEQLSKDPSGSMSGTCQET